jgi:gluconate 2-dehydrogenase gamma chain
MPDITRRRFLGAGSATLGALTAAGPAVAAPESAKAAAPAPSGAPVSRFFNADEAQFIHAAVDRLIPAGDGPGAVEAQVPAYLDAQLGGAWGAGERLYRSGPWHNGLPTQGYQLPYTPAELFRHALRAIAEDLQGKGKGKFATLPPKEQDAYLTALQNGKVDLGGIPSNVFFESLLGLTIEGFFSDPAYGGNAGMAGWKLIGFPGAYANYYHLVDRHGLAFTQPPISLADNGRGGLAHQHDLPASTPATQARPPAGQGAQDAHGKGH